MMEKVTIFSEGRKVGEGVGKIPYEKTKRLRERLKAAQEAIYEAADHETMLNGIRSQEDMVNEIVKQKRQHINKMVYDLAERNGVSIWDICLNYMPECGEVKFTQSDGKVQFEQDLRLVPLPFELVKSEEE